MTTTKKTKRPLVGTRNADGSVRVKLPETVVQTHARKPATSSRETSPAVAATAASLMHDKSAAVRRVAASALAQTASTAPTNPLWSNKLGRYDVAVVPRTAFNADDFRAQLPSLAASGTVGFNLTTRADLDTAVDIATSLGYDTTVDVDALRVEVRKRTT